MRLTAMHADLPRRPSLRRRLTATSVLVLAGLTGALTSPPPAYAHDQVVSQTPAAGEHLDAAPHEVTVTFSSAPLDVGAAVVVLDDDAKDWTEGAPRVDGTRIVQDLGADLPEGRYEVKWRIVSADGHPLSESFHFSVGATVPAATTGATIPDISEPAASAASVVPSDDVEPATASWIPILGGAGVVVGAVLILVRCGRRARLAEASGTTAANRGEA